MSPASGLAFSGGPASGPSRCDAFLAGLAASCVWIPVMAIRLSPNCATSSSVPPRAST